MRKKWLVIGFALCLTLLLPISARAATDAELIAASNLDVTISGIELGIGEGREYLSIIGTVNGPSQVRDLRLWSWRESTWSNDEIVMEIAEATSHWKSVWPLTHSNTTPFTFGYGKPVYEKDYGRTYNALLVAIDENVDAVGYCIVRVTVPNGETYSGGDEEIVASGVCGDPNVNEGKNVTWTLNREGTLTISGTGDMADWVDTWGSYCDDIATVVIENGVTSIGEGAFYNCDTLTSVTIPTSVTSIKDWAFTSCNVLTNVSIPSSVTSIGKEVFEFCASLTSVTIPYGVTGIEDYVFAYCKSLTSMTIPSSVTSIGYGAFEGCSSLTSVMIPDSVTSIGEFAFRDCAVLSRVTIPSNVTSIGEYAFCGCAVLTSVTIPDSVTSIGKCVFGWCDALTDIYYGGSESEWDAAVGTNDLGLSDSVTIHYNYTPPTAIVSEITVSGDTLSVAVYTDEAATVYCAAYDNDGRFLGIEARQLAEGTFAQLTFTPDSEAANAKLMLVDAYNCAPLCGGEGVELSTN